MAKDDSLTLGEAVWMVKPRRNFCTYQDIRYGLRAFADQIQFSFAGAIPHAGQVVGYDSEPGHAA